MRPELEQKLFDNYPKIFQRRNSSARDSCMVWGICTGDGWYNILDSACHLITKYQANLRRDRANAIKFNRAMVRAEAGDMNGLIHYFNYPKNEEPSKIAIDTAQRALQKGVYHAVVEIPEQFIAEQVKEKFGTLRFYHTGGDVFCDSVISMAEAMSAKTCDVCGSPGKISGTGYIAARCDKHKLK